MNWNWILAIALVVVGCRGPENAPNRANAKPITPLAGANVAPTGNGVLSNNGATLIANNGGGLVGTVRGPASGLLSDLAAGVLADDLTGLVANNGGGLIGKAKRVLLQGGDGRTDLIGMATVVAVDAHDAPLSAPVNTDAAGHFEIARLEPSNPTVFVKATYERNGQTLTLFTAVAAPREPGRMIAEIDPASSLVAKKVLSAVAAGLLEPARLDAVAIAAITTQIAPQLGAKALAAAALGTRELGAKAFDALLAQNAPLAASLAETSRARDLGPLVGDLPPPKASPSVPSALPGGSPPSAAPGSPATPLIGATASSGTSATAMPTGQPTAGPTPMPATGPTPDPGLTATPVPAGTGTPAAMLVQITALAPGMATRGATIQLTGTGFSPTAANNTITFANGATATPISATATSLTATVPSFARTGAVTVKVGDRTSNSQPLTVRGPTLDAVSPTLMDGVGSFWKSSESFVVTLRGAGFSSVRADNSIRVGGTTVQNGEKVSENNSGTQIQFKIGPRVNEGTWTITVTVNGERSNPVYIRLDGGDGGSYGGDGCPPAPFLCP